MTFCPECLQWSLSEAVLDGARVAGVGADKPEQDQTVSEEWFKI